MDRSDVWVCRLAFSAPVRIRTWKKLAAQVQNGLSQIESLEILQKHAASRKSPLAYLFTHILDFKGRGKGLKHSLISFATPEEIMLITSGEESGRLAECLLMAAELLEAKSKIRAAVVAVVSYPLVLIAMCIGLLLIIALQVVPELANINDPEKWTGMSAMLYGISNFTASWKGFLSLLLFIVLLVSAGLAMPIWTGRLRAEFDRFPPWSIYRMIVGSSWLYTLATQMRAGIQLEHIMKSALGSKALTPYLKERIEAIDAQRGEGINIGEAMFRSGYEFPDSEIIDELRVYANQPGFQESLFEISRQWLGQSISSVQQKAQVFNMLCLLLLVGLVCILGISIMDMQSQIMTYGG